MTPRFSLRFFHNKDDLLYKHLPRILKLVILLAILNSLAQASSGMLSSFFNSSPSEQTSGSNSAPASSAASAPSNSKQANPNLFGNAPAAPVTSTPPPPSPAAAPVAPLNATLRGIVFFATAPERAMAIILDNNVNLEEGYRSGDWLPDQVAQVKEVHVDHVILEYNGQLETLRLPRDVGMGELLLSTDTQFAPPALPNAISMGSHRPPPPPPVTVVNVPPKTAQNMSDLRSLLLDNPEEAMSLAKFEFMYEDGAFLGVRLFSNKDPTVFEPFGIQSGDIVTHINGIKLTGDPSQLAEFYSQASAMKTVTVRILRYGRDGRLPMMFNFPFAP